MEGANAIANLSEPKGSGNGGWGDLFGRSAEYAGRAISAKKRANAKLTDLEGVAMAAGRSETGMRVKSVPPKEELVKGWSGMFHKPRRSSSKYGNDPAAESEMHMAAMIAENEEGRSGMFRKPRRRASRKLRNDPAALIAENEEGRSGMLHKPLRRASRKLSSDPAKKSEMHKAAMIAENEDALRNSGFC